MCVRVFVCVGLGAEGVGYVLLGRGPNFVLHAMGCVKSDTCCAHSLHCTAFERFSARGELVLDLEGR